MFPPGLRDRVRAPFKLPGLPGVYGAIVPETTTLRLSVELAAT